MAAGDGDWRRVLRPGDRFEKLVERAVVEHAEHVRASERAELAAATAVTVIDALVEMMLQTGYLVKKTD